jgi:hypothetical protein
VVAALLFALAVSPQAPSATALAGSTRVRLVEDAAPKPEVPLEQMSRSQLRAEYLALSEEMPSVAAPVAAIVVGGVGLFGSAVTALYAALFSLLFKVPLMTFLIAGIVAAGGAALLVVGIFTLRGALAERRPFSERMELLQERIDAIDGRSGDDVPLPPPPPTPSPATVLWGGPSASVALARF